MINIRIKQRFLNMKVNGGIKQILHSKHFSGNGKLLIGDKTKICFGKNSKISIKEHLFLGSNENYTKSGIASIINLNENAIMLVNGNTQIYYGADILLFKGATLEIGNSYINSNCRIRVANKVTIGDNCAISHDFTVMDSNFHKLDGQVCSASVTIGNHVWIGSRVTILPGVSIGDGAVIAAGSVVTQNVESKTLVAGVPARKIKEKIEWSE